MIHGPSIKAISLGDMTWYVGTSYKGTLKIKNPTPIQWVYDIRLLIGETVEVLWSQVTIPAGGITGEGVVPALAQTAEIFRSTVGTYPIHVEYREWTSGGTKTWSRKSNVGVITVVLPNIDIEIISLTWI